MNTIIVVVSVSTDRIGSRCDREIEVDADEWTNMSIQQRDEFCREILFEMIEWTYDEKI